VLFVAGLALPVCAQRGGVSGGGAHGGGGGVSGHAAPAFRGGTSFAAPRYGAPGGLSGSAGYARPGYGAGYRGGYGYRPGYGRGYYRGPVWGGAWLGAGYLGYPGYGLGDYGDVDASGYDDSAAAAGGAPDYDPNYGPAGPPPDYSAGVTGGYAAGPVPNYAAGPTSGYAAGYAAAPNTQGYRPAYQGGAATVVAVAPAADEDAVTLVFKDGRPPEHIHNYAMTRTTLYVQDPHHQEIPMDELDLPATEKANREAGVSFEVPQGAQ